MPNKIKVSLQNVYRSFASLSGERIEAIHDVSLEVEDAPAGR